MPQSTYLTWFSQITKNDTSSLGTKAANLGEMSALGLPVPNGYVVSAQAYFQFLAASGLASKISDFLQSVDIHESASVQKASTAIQKMLLAAKLPEEISQAIIGGYHQLSSKDVHVAVRASMVLTDAPGAAFDSERSAYLNVLGSEQLLHAIKATWATLYEPRAIFYRLEKGFEPLRVGAAVIVQRMVEAEVSGVLFSQHPITRNPGVIAIEAVWGLGEPISSGAITPDHYEVIKKDWQINTKEIVRQEWQLLRTTHKHVEGLDDNNLKLPVSVAWQRKQKLADRYIVDLAKLGQKLEEHFGAPQDIEWAYANHTLYIVQARPMKKIPAEEGEQAPMIVVPSSGMNGRLTPLLVGAAAAPGATCGHVALISSAKAGRIPAGSVLVVENADDQASELLDGAVALVANHGSQGSAAVLSAQEQGIPVVLGVLNATKMLRNGEEVTVDGTQGHVYEGRVALSPATQTVPSDLAHLKRHSGSPILGNVPLGLTPVAPAPVVTATKVMINLAEPKMAEAYAQKDIDGVGLLRAEYMLRELGEHPRYLLEHKKEQVIIDALSEGIKEVAKAFGPRPVIYRLSDLTSNQYRKLHGGEAHEPLEENPAIGYRGAYRYTTEIDVLKLEIQAIKKVRQHYKNVWVMVPFVRTPQELIEVKALISEEGLYRGGSFKLLMMAEVPSNVILLDQFIGAGIDGISIGSNDLTQLILGLDRHNPRVAAGFDERNEAVMWAMERLVTGAIRHGIMCSICGQAPSAYPELTKRLVEWGITSISVSPEAASATRRLVAEAEFELVRMGKPVKRKRE